MAAEHAVIEKERAQARAELIRLVGQLRVEVAITAQINASLREVLATLQAQVQEPPGRPLH